MLEPIQRKGALTFGSLVHIALEVRYPPGRKRGPLPQDTFVKLYDEQPRDFDQWDEEGNKVPARDLGAAMLEGYIKEYGNDDHIEIIAPEMRLAVDVYDRHNNYLCTWVGKGDAVYIDLLKSNKKLKLIGMMEHKTAKSIEEEMTVISGYGEQGLSYFWGASYVLREMGLLKEGQQIDHVMFNWLRKALPDLRPTNTMGHRLNKPSKDALLDECLRLNLEIPKRALVADLMQLLRSVNVKPELLGEISRSQPKPLFYRDKMDLGTRELDSINWRIRAEAWEMDQVRKKKLPLIKNPTKDCKWDCPFKEACEVHEMGGDYGAILELEFDRWDPYSDHNLLEEKT